MNDLEPYDTDYDSEDMQRVRRSLKRLRVLGLVLCLLGVIGGAMAFSWFALRQ